MTTLYSRERLLLANGAILLRMAVRHNAQSISSSYFTLTQQPKLWVTEKQHPRGTLKTGNETIHFNVHYPEIITAVRV